LSVSPEYHISSYTVFVPDVLHSGPVPFPSTAKAIPALFVLGVMVMVEFTAEEFVQEAPLTADCDPVFCADPSKAEVSAPPIASYSTASVLELALCHVIVRELLLPKVAFCA
jgi:hypothetical protein